MKQYIPQTQVHLRELTKDLMDEEFRWTAVSQTVLMIYSAFSSLKAALAQRDKKRSQEEMSLIKVLDLDRRMMMQMMLPPADAELTAGMSEEIAQATKLTAEESSRMQADYLQQQMQRGQEMNADMAAQRQQARQA
jgi:hypothetical protein